MLFRSVGISVYFLYVNRAFFGEFLRNRSDNLSRSLSDEIQFRVMKPEIDKITELLLNSDPRQQAFYYLEKLRSYAQSQNSTAALSDLDALQGHLFNSPPTKP